MNTPENSQPAVTRFAFLSFVAIALLVPVWVVRYPPLLDYPNHLASSFVLAHLHDPRFQFSKLYRAHWAFTPYVAMDVLLLALQKVVPVDWAGRILLSLCVWSLPLGVWWFIREANPGSDGLALWSLVMIFNSFFLYGYLAYCLSIGFGFAALALYLRYLERPRPMKLAILVGVQCALYSVHLLGFIMVGLMMTTYTALSRQPIRRIVVSWLLFLPGLLLFLLQQTRGDNIDTLTYPSLGAKAFTLLAFMRLAWIKVDSRLAGFIILLVLAFVIVVPRRTGNVVWNRAWVGVAAMLFVTYWLLPSHVGRAYDIDDRVLPFFFLTILATVRPGRGARWLALAAISVFFVRTAGLTYRFIQEQPRLAQLARSFEVTPPNARVLPLVGSADDRSIHFPDGNFWAYGVIRKGWLSPGLFDIPGVQPLRLRAETYVPGFHYDQPPSWDRVQEAYAYVWAYHARRFAPQLKEIGEAVFARDDLVVYRIHRARSADRSTHGQGHRGANYASKRSGNSGVTPDSSLRHR